MSFIDNTKIERDDRETKKKYWWDVKRTVVIWIFYNFIEFVLKLHLSFLQILPVSSADDGIFVL